MREPCAIEPIEAASPFAANRDEAGLLEHVQMPRRRGPGVLEPRSEVARRQLAAEMTKHGDDVPPYLVRKREEHGVHLVERGTFPVHTRLLAQELIVSKEGNIAAAGHCPYVGRTIRD